MAAPNNFEQERQRFQRAYANNPAANKNDGYFKQYQPWKASNPSPPDPLPTTAGSPNPLSATQGSIPTSGGGSLTPPPRITSGGNAAQVALGVGQVVIPGLVRQGPNYLNPTNPHGIFAPDQRVQDLQKYIQREQSLPPGFSTGPNGKPTPNPLSPQFWNPLSPISPFNQRSPFNPFNLNKRLPIGDDFRPAPEDPNDPNLHEMGPLNPTAVKPPTANEIGAPPKNSNLPPWLDPFKKTTQDPTLDPNLKLPPPLDDSSPYIYEVVITGIVNSRGVPLEDRHLRAGSIFVTTAFYEAETEEGSGTYSSIGYTVGNSRQYLVVKVRPGFSVSSQKVRKDGNPGTDPTNIVPETHQPFFPPLPDYLDDLAKDPNPSILDPNDFKTRSGDRQTSPLFPTDLAPVPKPLDPLHTPEPPLLPGRQPEKPKQEDPIVPPLFPFNPLQSPTTINPIQNPPTFEPGPVNPNQRLNDRGIFPSRKADVTATVSGSPLSPDVEIGGDPLRLTAPAPKITKPPPFEDKTPEQKKKEEQKNLPLPLLPPIFPKPSSPTGTIDPQTSDDITKSKEPPKPPTGTKPKCQDKCMAGLETGQQSILDKLNGSGINTALNAGESLLLSTINNKLGDQLPGGLAGKLGRLSEWLHLDRALNLMTFATTLHNAYFLSSGLTQTLFSMISNVLAAGGIKDAEKNPLDIGAILGKQVEAYAKSVLGVSTVDGIKAEWKKYSRIYQAASNLLFSIQSIGQSILGALEMVGSMVAKIGNAMRKWGVISEKAFGWMNQSPNYQNRFFTTLEKAEEVTSNIDSIASEVLSVQDTITQIGTQKTELENAVKQTEGSKQGKESPEAATVKATQEKAKTDSKPPVIPVTAERKPEA